MNVVLLDPITISISSAKLVVESDNRGTIEFMVLDQPVRLNIDSSDYIYDININVNDRVRLIENFGAFFVNSKGVVQEIVPDNTEDRAKVLFDEIYPDQTLNNTSAQVNSAVTSILAEVPLRILEKNE